MAEYIYMPWNNIYSTGYSKVDEEHKKLVSILNTLYGDILKCKSGEDYTSFQETVKNLLDYASFHFSHEERLMNLLNYPKYNRHKIRHDKFISDILEKSELYKDDPKLVSSQFLIYIRDWILEHIAVEDKDMVLYVTRYLKDQQSSSKL